MQRTIQIELFSYWHAGSGTGQGSNLDAVIIKDSAGLPYLPGRTLKGLLREGLQTCEDAGHIAAKTTERLCGRPGDLDASAPGLLFVSNARLPEEERIWLASEDGATHRAALYDRFASTKLTDEGIAENKTLRTVELCVPLTLTAEVQLDEANSDDWEALQKACSLIRCLGSHRNRGLGRCQFTLTS